MPMKKEYHKRVSPIVRNGGRCRKNHNPVMNTARTIIPPDVKPIAVLLLVDERRANTAPISHKQIDTAANT